MVSPNRLSHEDRRELILLLRLLKTHLNSAIESSIVPGTKTTMPEDKANVAADRYDVRLATRWIKRLKLPGRRKTNKTPDS